MISTLFSTKKKSETEFSKFIREASSRKKKRVFMNVIKKATEDQKKVIDENQNHRTQVA